MLTDGSAVVHISPVSPVLRACDQLIPSDSKLRSSNEQHLIIAELSDFLEPLTFGIFKFLLITK